MIVARMMKEPRFTIITVTLNSGELLRYRLPERYFIVSNQFWRHKDHKVVIVAITSFINGGGTGTVVLTGALKDSRGIDHIDELLQLIQMSGVHENFRLLGFLPRGEQIALMRRALAVIQPSRFEGWGTVLEDCRAIGQRVIASDIEVHLEQDLPVASYFQEGNVHDLVRLIEQISSEPNNDWERTRLEREEIARKSMEMRAKHSRERLVSILCDSIPRI